jgi:5-methylcytosine-specific restriction endonuclease McrA
MKRKCPVCNKKRADHLFLKGNRSCELCKIAKKHGQKLERKEASSKTWIKRLDKLIGPLVRSRGVCEATERPHKGVIQWAHIVSRSYHNTRWDLDNAFALCAGCHKFYTDRPLEWEQFVISKIGEDKLRLLKEKALTHEKVDYKKLYEELI